MLDADSARAKLLDGLRRLPSESVAIADAGERVLAADVTAKLSQPPSAVSAMDGYAIRWTDRAGPWQVIGESAAGRGFAGALGPGMAVRILTGAPVPDGADTVVVQEDVTRTGDAIVLTSEGPPAPGAHIRPAGNDFAAGTCVARSGDVVTPARLGLLAASGVAEVSVVRRPRVAMLATGDELVAPGTTPGPDQIVSSNALMLAQLVARWNGEAIDLGIAADDQADIEARIAAARDADILVTIGGASVGDHDLVRPALEAAGATLDFWRVAIRPGKPLIAGRLGDLRVLGLPGNPVSAFVCAQLFLQPMLRAMLGRSSELPCVVARTRVALSANSVRRDHLRARLALGADGWWVDPFPVQDSAMLSVLAQSNALIVRDIGATAAAPGDLVPVLLLDEPDRLP